MKETEAYLNQFRKIVGEAFLNSKEGKRMTKEEAEEFMSRKSEIMKNYEVSYDTRNFFKRATVIVKDKK